MKNVTITGTIFPYGKKQLFTKEVLKKWNPSPLAVSIDSLQAIRDTYTEKRCLEYYLRLVFWLRKLNRDKNVQGINKLEKIREHQ